MNYIKTNSMTPKEKGEVDALYEKCKNAYGLTKKPLMTNDFNVIKEAPCFILAYDGDLLVGYTFLFFVEKNETELYSFVSSEYACQGIFCEMEKIADKVFAEYKIERVIYAVEKLENVKASKRLQEGTLLRSEFGMRASHKMTVPNRNLTSVRIFSDDEERIKAATKILTEAFEENCEEFVKTTVLAQNTTTKVYLFYNGGEPIGSISVCYQFPQALLCGLAVAKKYQGKGFGKEILTSIGELSERPNYNLELEVVAQNEKALSLYLSCGFKQIYRVDCYLRKPVQDK